MTLNIHHYHHADPEVTAKLDQIISLLTQQGKVLQQIMAGVVDIQNADTTLHADLVAENGLIKQLLTAFANGNLTSTQAQALVDSMNQDDADAKSNLAAITAVLPPAAPAV